jgi:Uma2 family endonuclease
MVSHLRSETGLMSIDEFVRLYETEGPFEIIDRECKPKELAVAGYATVAKTIYDALTIYKPKQTNFVVYFETAFVIIESSGKVRVSQTSDVMLFQANRLATYKSENPNWEDKPFVLVPDLVVEVISQNDKYTDVEAKVDGYLEDGVQIVWVFDPRRKVVTVRSENSYSKLTVKGILSGGNVIPGFQIAVKAIFE